MQKWNIHDTQQYVTNITSQNERRPVIKSSSIFSWAKSFDTLWPTQTVLPTKSTQLTQYTVGALIYHVTQVAAAVCLFCVRDLLFRMRVSSYIVGHWHREARASCSVAACLNLGARAWSSGASITGDVSGDVRRYEEPYTVTSKLISGSLTPRYVQRR